MSAQQFRPEGRARREPVAEVPFFAPPRGEFPVDGGGFGPGPGGGSTGGFGGGFGGLLPQGSDARFATAPAAPGHLGYPGAAGHPDRSGWGPSAPEEPVRGLEDVAGLGRAAVALAVVATATSLVAALTGLAAGTSLVAALVTALLSLVHGAVLVANWIVVALWLRRARRNAERIDPRSPQRRAAVWAWFGWFVPVAAFFVPFQYVSDVWRASQRRAPRGTSPQLSAWWAVWLLSLGLGNVSFRLSEQGSGTAAAALAVAAALATLVALPLFRGVVRSVAVAQQP